MKQKQDTQIFKKLLNEFSSKPYISMTQELYPIDSSDDEVKPEYDDSDQLAENDSDYDSSSDDEELSPKKQEKSIQEKTISDKNAQTIEQDKNAKTIDKKTDKHKNNSSIDKNMKPDTTLQIVTNIPHKQRRQKLETARLKIFAKMAPQDFLEIKKQFSYYDNSVSVTQFVIVFLEVLRRTNKYTKELEEYVKSLIYLFQLIDVYVLRKISFDQLSNFLVEMHELLARDQNLFEIKLKRKNFDQQYQHNPIERLYDLQGYHGFAYLEQNLKQLRLVNPHTWEDIVNISIGATTIVSAYFLESKNSLIISSNDKFLNFFDLKTHKLQRRFMVPDVQSYLQCSSKKGIIYTAAVNGAIYSWDLERIFSKDFLKAMNKHPDCFKLVIKNVPISCQDDLTCFLIIESLQIIATGANDMVIRLYENKNDLSKNHKKLKGHVKGIKGLAYSSHQKYLISCSYDFDVLVWNIYLDHPLAKLVGHEAPLITILTVQERKPHQFSLLLSCDAKGVLRVWDPKTFSTIQVITLSDSQDQRVKSIIYKREANLLIVGYKSLLLLEIDRSFDPNLTDDQPIQCICYSKKYFEIYFATARHIKAWNLQKGLIKRVFKDIISSDITAMALDSSERRLFLGTHNGIIIVVDAFTGFKLREINSFTKEVCFLAYSLSYEQVSQNIALSCQSSRWSLMGHADQNFQGFQSTGEGQEERKRLQVIRIIIVVTLRIIQNSHPQEIVTAQFSEHLMLIATTSREGEVRVWDFEKVNLVWKIKWPNNAEITALRFLDPFPLLLSADSSGTLYIYVMRPHKLENQVAIIWKNMFTILKAATVTCIEHLVHGGQLHLILGDDNGDIRIMNLQEMVKRLDVKEMDGKEIAQNKNPHRFFQYTFQEYEQKQDQGIPEALVGEKCASQVFSWHAHKQGLKCVVLVHETEEELLVTYGFERMVKIWNLRGQLVGQFKQGVDPKSEKGPFELKWKKSWKTVEEETEQEVRKKFNEEVQFKEKFKRAKTIPFKKEEEDVDSLVHVDSKEIFKNLQEITRYLDRNSEAELNKKK